jgi:hypothetical protein
MKKIQRLIVILSIVALIFTVGTSGFKSVFIPSVTLDYSNFVEKINNMLKLNDIYLKYFKRYFYKFVEYKM